MKHLKGIMSGNLVLPNLKLIHISIVTIAIAVIGYAAIALAFDSLVEAQQETMENSDKSHYLNELVKNIENGVVDARRIEKEFLLSSEPQHVVDNKKTLEDVNNNIDKLHAAMPNAGNGPLADALRSSVNDYGLAFDQMVESMTRMGLDHNSGAHGKLRKAVHEVEGILNEHDELALAHSMLMMRRHEKDYLARKLEKYLAKMENEQARFAGLLNASPLPADIKTVIKAKMQDYYKTFLEIPPLHSEIDTNIHAVDYTMITASRALQDIMTERDVLVSTNRARSIASRAAISRDFYTIVGCVGIAVAVLLTLLTRMITRPVRVASEVADSIAAGNFDNAIDIKSPGEPGQLLDALGRMQANLRAQIERDRKTVAENGRIRQALDNVDAGVMIADTNHNIIYLNEALVAMMGAAQDDIRKDLPHFDVETLMGSSIEVFYKDPEQLHAELDALDDSITSELVLGGRTLDIVTNPVSDASGKRLGTVLEWSDRTQEVLVEEEIQDMVDEAMEGNLSTRIDLRGKVGFLRNPEWRFQCTGRCQRTHYQ